MFSALTPDLGGIGGKLIGQGDTTVHMFCQTAL